MKEEFYDIFISYAREDGTWVRENLFNPLLGFVTAEKSRPKIFMDISELGVRQGENYLTSLAKAIQMSRRVILIYSRKYFEKEMTNWELTKALQLDPSGKKGKINPLLIEPEAEDAIPFEVSHIHYLDSRTDNWFDRLTKNMSLIPLQREKKRDLIFITEMTDIPVNNTLTPVKVTLSDKDDQPFFETNIEISSQGAGLQGTKRMKTSGGLAVFSDLSFKTLSEKAKLIVNAEGYSSSETPEFRVYQPLRKPPTITDSRLQSGKDSSVSFSIQHCHDAVFFKSGNSFLAFTDSCAEVFRCNGERLGEIPLPNPIRFIRTEDQTCVLADWTGLTTVVQDDGISSSFSFPEAAGRKNPDWKFSIPADCAFSNKSIFLSFWNGDIFQLEKGGKPELIFHHQNGIQAMDVAGDNIVLCSFLGELQIVRGETILFTEQIERHLLNLSAFSRNIVIIGRRDAFQLALQSNILVKESLMLSDVVAVHSNANFIIAVDEEGKGVRIDEDLVILERFHTTVSAQPHQADQTGLYSIFRYPQNVRALMTKGRIVYTHRGVMSISPDSKQILLGNSKGLTLHDSEYIQTLCRGN